MFRKIANLEVCHQNEFFFSLRLLNWEEIYKYTAAMRFHAENIDKVLNSLFS